MLEAREKIKDLPASSNNEPSFNGYSSSTSLASKKSLVSKNTPKKVKSNFSRDEMNLAEFPLAVLSTRVDSKIKTLEFTDYTRSPAGEMIERKWIITGADKFGLPTSTDDDVILGLMRLSFDQGFRDPKVYFTRYELLRALRWTTEGRSYQRLIKSLDRLSGVRIRSTNSFYDNSTKSYQTSNFGIVDAYEINDERQSGEKNSFFIWSDMLFDSFKSGYIKKLDLDLYFTLKSAISRRLYRYLDKHFYFKNAIDAHLYTLAFEKLSLSRTYKYVSSIKQQLAPALEELMALGFISSFEYSGDKTNTILRMVKGNQDIADNQPRVIYEKEPPAKEPDSYNASPPTHRKVGPEVARDESNLIPFLQKELISRGLSYLQTEKLLTTQSQENLIKIGKIVKFYDELCLSNDKRVSKNSIGFLYRAVESPYKITLPEELKTKGGTQGYANSKRPEHKVFKAKRVKSQHSDSQASQVNAPSEPPQQEGKISELKLQYKEFVTNSLNCIMTKMSPVELGELYAGTETKMKSLERILGKDRYTEAIDACVKDELKRRFRVNGFEDWRKEEKK